MMDNNATLGGRFTAGSFRRRPRDWFLLSLLFCSQALAGHVDQPLNQSQIEDSDPKRFTSVVSQPIDYLGENNWVNSGETNPVLGKRDPLNPEGVRRAIRDGIEFLKERQMPDGSWTDYQSQGDATALCTLALLVAEDNPQSPEIQRAILKLLTIPREERTRNYFLSLRIMVLALADPGGEKYRRELVADVRHLLDNQFSEGAQRGGWAYDKVRSQFALPDASNSQFAILALHEASRVGVEIPQQHWQWAREYWLKCFDPSSGGFYYRASSRGELLGSMTCAGISSWIIINENLASEQPEFEGDRAICCRPSQEGDVVEASIDWLVRNYTVRANPVRGGRGNNNILYFLYGLERAGRLSGRRFFGPNDWYRDGAQELIQRQMSKRWSSSGHGEDVPHIGTSLALLFLAKGKTPIAIGKYQYGRDMGWDHHPKGVHYLTSRLEQQWQQKLNWQTVSGADATVDDLLEAPVLFLSGRESLDLSAAQKENLKKYLDNGGFLFAEGCQGEGCGDGNFDRDFRKLMQELFPESELEVLESNHPVWNAHYPLLPNRERPLWGLRACCRTAVIYCPANLSCYWALDRKGVLEIANQGLVNRIEYCGQLGVNVVTYATGRMLREKGETPKLVENKVELLTHRVLEFPKLSHSGGADDAPNALRILLRNLQAYGMRIKLDKNLIDPLDENLFDFPLVFMHGRSSFRFENRERERLKTYLENGGFLFVDAICSAPMFERSVRDEILQITGQTLRPIARDHDIWHSRYGGRIDSVTLRTRDSKAPGGFVSSVREPVLEGIEINGKLAVVFSPHDLSCALENATFSQCDGYTHEDAAKLGEKIILYSLLGDR
jgi:hypothetical protein